MSRTIMLERREFIRHAAAFAAGAAGVSFVGVSPAEASSTTSAWLLNPNWGYPLGLHGRTSCTCHVCPPHAANKIFASESAALAGRAHNGCPSPSIEIVLPTTTYDSLFPIGVTSVDRRDPAVAAILALPIPPPPPSPSAPAPAITGFSPGRGRVGDHVVVTGVGLDGASSVAFGDVPVSEMVVDSDSQVSATVPSGASTGAITVALAGATLTSLTRFVVVHDRGITLAVSGTRGIGTVGATDGELSAVAGATVKLQHHRAGGWKTLARVVTDDDGSFRVRGLNDLGRYRAVATRSVLSSGDLCLRAVSPVRTR